jgi:hypothetical protein
MQPYLIVLLRRAFLECQLRLTSKSEDAFDPATESSGPVPSQSKVPRNHGQFGDVNMLGDRQMNRCYEGYKEEPTAASCPRDTEPGRRVRAGFLFFWGGSYRIFSHEQLCVEGDCGPS